MKIFEPSSFEQNLSGPKTFKSCFLRKSTIPFTKGSSGPTIVKSITFSFKKFFIFSKSFRFISTLVAIFSVPPFPGIQNKLFTFLDS